MVRSGGNSTFLPHESDNQFVARVGGFEIATATVVDRDRSGNHAGIEIRAIHTHGDGMNRLTLAGSNAVKSIVNFTKSSANNLGRIHFDSFC